MPADKYLASDAWFSDDMRHRYWLSRRLAMGERIIAFVGLNPSTADATKDDPTVRKCAVWARRWGFDRFYMLNLMAYRSTDPTRLKGLAQIDAVGPLNQEAVLTICQRAEIVVAAWGANPLPPAAEQLAALILRRDNARCLGRNQGGSPKHPLYLPMSTMLQRITGDG